MQGRSPRARGRHFEQGCLRVNRRPIPAGAGQTSARSTRKSGAAADPRGRGADALAKPRPKRHEGRSPRARGRPLLTLSQWTSRRPIPAGAGQTLGACHRCSDRGADPRGRGADSRLPSPIEKVWGRSPRARGRRAAVSASIRRYRPIPAGAGQTSLPYRTSPKKSADPRGRGADSSMATFVPTMSGRSPRARGRRLMG